MLDEVDRPGGIPGGQSVIDSIVEVAMFGKPARCGAVKVFDLVGTILPEPTTEKLGEHLMVAEPVPVVVDVLQEEAPPLDLLEHGLPAGHIC